MSDRPLRPALCSYSLNPVGGVARLWGAFLSLYPTHPSPASAREGPTVSGGAPHPAPVLGRNTVTESARYPPDGLLALGHLRLIVVG